MSLPPITRAAREIVKRLLVNAYNLSHGTSGEVKVTHLGFSSNPRQWRLTTTSHFGLSYHTFCNPEITCRNDIHIHAVVSRQWLNSTDMLHHYTQGNHHHLIAGIHNLPPPAGVDRLELLCQSKTGNLHLDLEYCFRFTACGISAIPDARWTSYPSKAAIVSAHTQFNQIIAFTMAARLSPHRGPNPSISTCPGVIHAHDPRHRILDALLF